MSKKVFPKLFKRASNGRLSWWQVATDDNRIITKWCNDADGGAVQETVDVIKAGKNEGRKNATSAAEQALKEAESLHTKKLKKGYAENKSDAVKGKVSSIIEGGIFPMLAHRFDQHAAKLMYPCFVQPKLDGHRCIAMVDQDNNVTLWSRTRKRITSMVHIEKAIAELELGPGVILDGELYNHDYHNRFEELTSFIRASEPKPGCEVVEYHIYDVVDSTIQSARVTWLRDMFFDKKTHPLVRVKTKVVSDEDDLMTAFADFTADNYEGIMARSYAGLYMQNKRSYDLLKVKEFFDDEFEIVGTEEGRGKLAGHAAAFVCTTKDGNEFRAKLMGEQAKLKTYWQKPKAVIGKMVTVKYQGMTKNGVPRFPVAVRIRED